MKVWPFRFCLIVVEVVMKFPSFVVTVGCQIGVGYDMTKILIISHCNVDPAGIGYRL